MRYKSYIIAVTILTSLIASSCGTALYMPAAEDEKNGHSLSGLLKGRELYKDKCGRCHGLYLPEKLTMREWDIRIDEMQSRANISDEEKKLIREFLSLKARR